jgi:hypothetical protein
VNENEWTNYFLFTIFHVAEELNFQERDHHAFRYALGVLSTSRMFGAAGYGSYPSVTKIACLTRCCSLMSEVGN